MSKIGRRISKLFTGGKKDKKEKEPSGSSTSSAPAAAAAGSSSTAAPANGSAKKAKIAIVIYSMYGHIATLAESVSAGVKEAGGEATIYQIPETLDKDVLEKLYAPPKPAYPLITPDELATYDAFLFGIPTRYGNQSAQWRAFWDSTGQLWQTGALVGKYAGLFVSTAGPGGGQEATIFNSISTLTHHGILYVPLGYKSSFAQLTNLEEPHGGSPWGSGTFAAGDGSRQPTALELEIAKIQGKSFTELYARTL